MNEEKVFTLECNACKAAIKKDEIRSRTYHVKDDVNKTEIKYLSCPRCGQRYFIGIYDKNVRSLFKRGKRNKGKALQEQLKEQYQEEIQKVMERKSNHAKI